MAMLVGIYLLQVEAIEVPRDDAGSWTATWTLLRSPSGNQLDWEPLVWRDTTRTFPREADALRAGHDEGTAFARMLQADDGLEPMVSDELREMPMRETMVPARRSCVVH